MSEVEIIKSIVFYAFALTILGFALMSIFSYRIIYSLICSVVVFFAAAGIYFILGADYNAVVQIAIYGIAVPVLFLFAILFTSHKLDKSIYISTGTRFLVSFFACGLLFLSMVYLFATSLSVMTNSDWLLIKQTAIINKYAMFSALAEGLYIKYVVAFELFSILLLIVIVGISTLRLQKEDKRD